MFNEYSNLVPGYVFGQSGITVTKPRFYAHILNLNDGPATLLEA